MEYTKGPWEWVRSRFYDGYSGIVGADNVEVLFPNCCNDGDEGAAWFEDFPNEADRDLISAAPDMYEALKEMVEVLEGIIEAGDYIEDSTIDKARQAIAKAEGRRA